MLVPAVVDFSRDAESVVREERLERLAQAMQLPAQLSVEQALAHKAEALRLPTGLAQMGVDKALIPRIVTGALADHSHKTNPREATADDYAQLIQASF